MNAANAFCQINLEAIAANFRALGHPDALMPVVKADAYGHGLIPVAQTLAASGAQRFAVGTAAEGIALRQSGIIQPIALLLGCHDEQEWRQAAAFHLTPIVASPQDIQAAQTAAGANELAIAIKCDSGMGRLGFPAGESHTVLELLRGAPALRPAMVISHLACADMPEEGAYTAQQRRRFGEFHQALASAYPTLIPSLGNSAATLCGLSGDMGRPGLALYGGDPQGRDNGPPLRWAMAVGAPVLAVRHLAAGESVSYGRAYTAPAPMKVAVIACGYANGLARSLSNRISVLLNGKRQRQLGRICMSMAVVDITSDPSIRPGDVAWVLGGPTDGDKPVDPWEMARLLDTIPYEIICRFGSMNPRTYVDG